MSVPNDILVATVNVVFNIRANAAGLLNSSSAREVVRDREAELRALARSPETADSEPIPLAALTEESLRSAMQLAVLSMAMRRWHLLSATQTPNAEAFRTLLATRYGLTDDVPHAELLASMPSSGST